jgi:hypothetical protein
MAYIIITSKLVKALQLCLYMAHLPIRKYGNLNGITSRRGIGWHVTTCVVMEKQVSQN